MPNNQTQEEVHERLKTLFQESIPSGIEIANSAIAEEISGHEDDIEWIKANCSNLVENIQWLAYDLYLEAEREIGSDAIVRVFRELAEPESSGDQVLNIFAHYFEALDRFFLGLTQGRRARAGSAFEIVMRELFTRLGYPFSPNEMINGRPDFVLPSATYYRQNPLDCIVFTTKRILRERWRQIVTEGIQSLGFFLATIDESKSESELNEMVAGQIFLVVPARIKNEVDVYSIAPNVISFETFMQFHLDPAMERWREAGIVE